MDVVITLMVPTILYVESFPEQILYFSIQVYLVTGGYFGTGDNYNYTMTFHDSTEVLIKDANSWNVIKNPLPQPMANIGMISQKINITQ